jgi:hypothetical protein
VLLDEDAPWARRTATGWTLTVRVQPGAPTSAVVGPLGDAVKIRVAAPADDGKANAELVRFLATHLGVPARSVEIIRGHHNRTKVVEVTTAPPD